jgi:hypothetical protein
VERLKLEIEADPAASARRRKAAQERAARDILERAQSAKARLEQLKAAKQKRAKTHAKDEGRKGEPKVSLTDPEARHMRFADGSVKAGYNIQVAATGKGVVVSVAASDRRNDSGLAVPMVEDIERRYGRVPNRALVDTNYATAEDIVSLAIREGGAVDIYAPPPPERQDVKPETLKRRTAERAREPAPLKEWRQRMDTEQGKAIYGRRKRIELVNAHFKNRGLDRPNLRGLLKTRILALWHALAHNILVAHRLRCSPA